MMTALIILLTAAALAAAEWKWGVLRLCYDKSRASHRAAALAAVLVCLLCVPLFLGGLADAREDIPYPLEHTAAHYNPYIEQFDAFMKGQLHIDYEPDPRLAALEDPYDYFARSDSGAYYLWDRALYDGKYYSYFGIAPIVTFYYPYYLTHGALPGDSTVMAFFLMLTALFLPLALFEWAGISERRVPLVPLLLSAPALVLSSGALLAARGVNHFYYIAVIAGMAFLSAFLFFALAAYNAKRTAPRILLYVAAGVAFALLFHSRLNIALLCAFLVIPGLWFMIIRRPGDARPARVIIGELAALGTPVAAALCFSFWFNAARFSGPLDFGTNYQLTVANVATYKLRLSDLPFAIYNYFLAPAEACETYPYITFTRLGTAPTDHYIYRDANLGLFCLPLTLGILAAPITVFRSGNTARQRTMAGAAFLGIVALAWINFCKGGVIYRYMLDLATVAAFLSVALLLPVAGDAVSGTAGEERPRVRGWLIYAAVCAFLLISIAGALRVSLINGHSYISAISEEVLEILERFLPFPGGTP